MRPEPTTLAGALTLTNPGSEARRVTVVLGGVLKPLLNPRLLAATQLEQSTSDVLLQTPDALAAICWDMHVDTLGGTHDKSALAQSPRPDRLSSTSRT